MAVRACDPGIAKPFLTPLDSGRAAEDRKFACERELGPEKHHRSTRRNKTSITGMVGKWVFMY